MQTILQLIVLVAVALAAGVVYTLSTQHLTLTVPENRYRDALVCRRAGEEPQDSAGSGVASPAGGDSKGSPSGDPASPADPAGATAGAEDPKNPSGESPIPANETRDDHDHGDGETPRIELDEAFALWEEGALFVDARRTKEYQKGHIPGAVSISPWESTREERAQALAEKEPKEAPVVVYCTNSEDCHDSKEIAGDLKTLDFTNVMIFSGGWPEWETAKKPAATGDAPGARPGF